MMLIVWTLLFQIKSVKLVSLAGDSLSPAAMRIITLVLLDGTWEEAREDCKGKNSDLAVARTPAEKAAIKEKSIGYNGYWIGLRVVNKQWKWVDGSDLTDSSWIDLPDPVDGHCAVFSRAETHGQQ
ncbi:hypothetical protein F7725_017871 [Dissostichus mawsoni]|uniref:C-type lectin domain-containing protein n=1 Tax=Dissostichus mawsoni TaxID=36200 RepID=A0A7J5XPY0_DISMA|nr:hypothetical protein F7725_017871 [Dissostichus mawsoni]